MVDKGTNGPESSIDITLMKYAMQVGIVASRSSFDDQLCGKACFEPLFNAIQEKFKFCFCAGIFYYYTSKRGLRRRIPDLIITWGTLKFCYSCRQFTSGKNKHIYCLPELCFEVFGAIVKVGRRTYFGEFQTLLGRQKNVKSFGVPPGNESVCKISIDMKSNFVNPE